MAHTERSLRCPDRGICAGRMHWPGSTAARGTLARRGVWALRLNLGHWQAVEKMGGRPKVLFVVPQGRVQAAGCRTSSISLAWMGTHRSIPSNVIRVINATFKPTVTQLRERTVCAACS